MARMRRVIGPPGTGKTTWVQGAVEAWLDDGLAADQIMLTSHTRVAARVLARRIELPEDRIGTLHAMAYRALGRPAVAEEGRLARGWNEQAPPEWQITEHRQRLDDPLAEIPGGEGQLWDALQRWRARHAHEPGAEPPAALRRIAEAWDAWCWEHDAVDYTGMLAEVARRGLPPPRGVRIMVVDEAQDLTPGGWALVRHWAQWLDEVVVAGDPAQAIYQWAGASPEPLLEPGWDELMLDRSHRLPGEVHRWAESLLLSHSGGLHRGRWYRPRPVDGVVERAPWPLRDAMSTADAIEDAMRSGTVMMLATAGYMLRPLIAELRRRGVPYGNPYRPGEAAWNPLRRDIGEGRVSTAERVLRFLRPMPEAWGEEARLWAPEDLVAWAAMLRADQYRVRGFAARLQREGARPELLDELAEALTDEARAGMEALDLGWLAGAVRSEYAEAVGYMARVARRCGAGALAERPRCIIGTIHSVKGGEAATVLAAPDISPAAAEEAVSREGRDALIRLLYVAATRAAERLVLLAPGSRHAVL